MLESQDIIKFYKASRSFGQIDLLDLLLKRYTNIEYIMNMEATDGFELIAKAVENDSKDKMYIKWLHDEARYTMSFDEYYQQSLPYRKSTDEEKEQILERFGGE